MTENEREWSKDEFDKLFRGESVFLTGDAINIPITFPAAKNAPIEWGTGAWNGPHIELDPNDPFGHMQSLFSSGIHVTAIVPPEQGWPIVAHCKLCQKTEIILSPWAIKPEDGDYWKMEGMCLDEELHMKHNMWPQREPYPWKETR